MTIGIKIPKQLFAWFKTGVRPALAGRPGKTIPARKNNSNERSDRARSPESVPFDLGDPRGDLIPQ